MSLPQRPWYREPFVWLIIGLPLTSVVVGGNLLYQAIRTNDGLVVDDYYQAGKEINRVLDRDYAARQHGLSAKLELLPADQLVTVQLTAGHLARLPERVRLGLFHSTRAGFDATLTLERGRDGLYHGAAPTLAPGRWDLQLEADDWRLVAAARMPGGLHVDFAPAGDGVARSAPGRS